MAIEQSVIDNKNADFWTELCGSGLARSLGIEHINPDSLEQFDVAYLKLYPYLLPMCVNDEDLRQKKILEIGLGYGTLSQVLMERASYYHGLDISPGPVNMVRNRLSFLGCDDKVDQVRVGTALNIEYPDNYFDYVYSIGVLHHTGNLPQSIREVYRVLKPNGKAHIMLYNRLSFRQLFQVPYGNLKNFRSNRKDKASRVRAMYDANEAGESAPHTDYVTFWGVWKLFRQFKKLKLLVHNMDTYVVMRGRYIIPRERLLNNIGRILGLDTYIFATK